METTKNSACTCNSSSCPNKEQETVKALKKSAKTIPSIVLSFLVAFFPKCPVCWAVYMSMLGSFGIAEIPYMKWLLPVFMVFLGFHLWMLLKKVPSKGYGPFLVSLLGFGIIIPSKILFNAPDWLSIIGMSFIVIGSLWNSFTLPKNQQIILN